MTNEPELTYPKEYNWVVERGLAGFGPFTQLQPWFFTPKDQSFWATKQWNHSLDKDLFVFARRQDNDEFACFSFDVDGNLEGIVVVQGWIEDGFEVLREFSSFWEWFKFVIDDISDWIGDD
jgi:hypothetical protein